jgi:hypothetical protein
MIDNYKLIRVYNKMAFINELIINLEIYDLKSRKKEIIWIEKTYFCNILASIGKSGVNLGWEERLEMLELHFK